MGTSYEYSCVNQEDESKTCWVFWSPEKIPGEKNHVHRRPSSELCGAGSVSLECECQHLSETQAELPPLLGFCSGLFFILVIRTVWFLWEHIIESMLAEYLWWMYILANFLDFCFLLIPGRDNVHSHCIVPFIFLHFWLCFLWRPEININPL